jgi:hypothetical protein
MSEPISIEAPDAASAAELMSDAIGLFDAELVESDGRWEVLVRPDRPRERLIVDVLDLVQTWVESTGLRSVTVRLGDRDYLAKPSPAGLAGRAMAGHRI